MSFIAVGAVVGSVAIKQYQQDKVADAQDASLAGSLEHQGAAQGQIDDIINQLLTSRTGSSPAGEKAQLMGDFQHVLAANHATDGVSAPPAASDAYREAAHQAAGAAGDYGRHIADLMSTADAFSRQRSNEADTTRRYLDRVNQIRALARDQSATDQLGYNAIQPDAFLGAASDVLGAFGSHYMPAVNSAGMLPGNGYLGDAYLNPVYRGMV